MAHNLMKAHGQAVINLRKYAKQKIRVGYAPTLLALHITDGHGRVTSD